MLECETWFLFKIDADLVDCFMNCTISTPEVFAERILPSGSALLAGLKIIFFLLSNMMSVMDVFHAKCTSFMSGIFTLPLAKL